MKKMPEYIKQELRISVDKLVSVRARLQAAKDSGAYAYEIKPLQAAYDVAYNRAVKARNNWEARAAHII